MGKMRLENCAVVRDLLPNYIEHLTSEETNELIEEHLESCRQCTEYRDVMTTEVKVDAVIENQNEKRIFKRARNLWIAKGIIRTLMVIAVLTCTIVDLAVTHKLSWSLIVDGAIAYAATIFETAVSGKEHVMLRVLRCVSIGVLPLLYLIQIVTNHYFVNPPVYWFTSYALPITAVWLAIVWGTVGLCKAFRLNCWSVMGCFFAAAIIGSPVTTMIAARVGLMGALLRNYEWIDILAYVVLSCIFWSVGRNKKRK